MYDNQLDAKVAAVNNAHRYAMELFPKLREVFEPFVGKKIFKGENLILEKINKLLPEFPYDKKLTVYHHKSNYSLVWNVRTCEGYTQSSHQGGTYETSAYHEIGVYVGNVEDGILKSLHTPQILKTDYSADHIRKLREKYKEAKKAADDAQGALFPFGE